MDFGAPVELGLEPVDEPPAPPLPAAEDEAVEDLVAVKVARLRVALRVIGMPEVPKLAPVPAMGMVAFRGILEVTTRVLFCDEVMEMVVATEVIDADEDPVIDADEESVAEADGLEPEPPLMLNSFVKLMSDPWLICKA